MPHAHTQPGPALTEAIDDQFEPQGPARAEYSRNGTKVRVTESNGQKHVWSVISKPKNADKCKLNEKMELGARSEVYNEIQGKIRRDTQAAIGDGFSHFLWDDCPIPVKSHVSGAALARFPYLYRFRGNWAALEMMKRSLRRAREDRIRRERLAAQANATMADAEVNRGAGADAQVDNNATADHAGAEHPAPGTADGWGDEVDEVDEPVEGEQDKGEQDKGGELEAEPERPQIGHADDDSDRNEVPRPRGTRKRTRAPDSDDEEPSRPSSLPQISCTTSPVHNPTPRPSVSKGKGKALVPKEITTQLTRNDSWAAGVEQELQDLQEAPRPPKKTRTQKPTPDFVQGISPETSNNTPSGVNARPTTKVAKKTRKTAKKAVQPSAASVAGPSNHAMSIASSLSPAPSLPPSPAPIPSSGPRPRTQPGKSRKAKAELVDKIDSNVGATSTTSSKRGKK